MYKNKVLFRVLLICICITLVAGCLGISVSAASSANSVLQVNSAGSSASLKDGTIQVSLGQEDVFTYNEILNLSAASKNVPLLNMQFNPSMIGTADAPKVYLRFTDIYDENNYITITLTSLGDTWASGHIYVTAGAADQPQIGIENAGDPNNSKPHINDVYGYGAAVDYSLAGLPKSSEDTHLTLYFDYAEKAIYADRETYTHAKQLVVDLDEDDYFGSELWEGFTTGQAKFSVFASNYQAATCNFTISAINGNSNLSDRDQSAPIISVNTGYAQDALPTALVGKPYPIFPATVLDGCDKNAKETSAVYYESSTGSKQEVAVVDGKFTPSEAGAYIIEYTARDFSGNASTASLRVNAVVGSGLQVTLQNVVSETDTGTLVQLFSGVDCIGASGNVSYRITAKNAANGDVLEIDPQTCSFIPMEGGDWEITVTVQDYISTVVKTFTVKANRTSQPQVYDTVAVPDYFVQGATYNLPVLYGYDFSSGKGVLKAMDVYVTESGGSEKAVTNRQYTPSTAGAVKVTYRLTVDGKSCEKTYNATVVKVKSIINTVQLNKYFVDPTGAATGTTSSSKITYSFKKDTKLNFVNFVQVKQMTFGFQVGSQKAYNKISVYLTDVISGKQVKLSYTNTDSGVMFSVNDGGTVTLTSAFDSAFTLAFSGDTGIVTPETGKKIKVNNFLDGSEFTGFTDSIARFTVELSGVTGSSQFVMQTLNGQKLSNATKDSVAPQFIADALSGSVEKGERLQLKGAFVYDVLNPIATVTLKVTDPDGTVVTDENGIVLNGTQDASKDTAFTMDKLGTYTIFYTTTDGAKNTGRHIYTLTVTDGEGPTITLSQHTKTVKPGETVTVATAQVQDNVTSNCTVASYVYNPEGVKIDVTNGTFVASMEGVYTVRYMAFDGDGNYSFATYEVTARPEEVHYLSQSMSLGSDLILHLWGNVPEGYAGSISGSLTYDGATNKFKLSELTKNENGLYHMQTEMAVAQMTEHVDLTLKHNIIGEIIRRQYSIRDYLVALIEGNFDQATKDLSLELLNMGAWAQKYFDYDASNLANQGYVITPANAVPAQSPEVAVDGGVSGIRFYGTSVRFLSKAAVRFYFAADGATDGYTFTINGTEYEPVAKDGLYYIETPGINPQDMSNVITVNVTDGSTTFSAQYAPIWYFVRTYNSTDDAVTKGLMAAAYSYYKEAEAYEQSIPSGNAKQPEAPTGEGVYISLDVLVTTLGNSNDPVEIGFYPYDYAGRINEGYADRVTVTAGKKTTVRLNAEKYMVDGVIPEGLGIAIFGGPEWNTKLPDGYTPDRHTLIISNAWLKGAYEKQLDLNTASVATGKESTGFTDANGSGAASIIDGQIVIENGFRYDGYKIALNSANVKSKSYIYLDMQIDTLGGNWINDVEMRFYAYNFEGNPHEVYDDQVIFKAGELQTVKLDAEKYLVDGKLTGIGIGIFGGPTWDAKLPDGYTPDRHTLTISGVKLEGAEPKTYDLSKSVCISGTGETGYTVANNSGVASFTGDVLKITNGYCYDCHKLSLSVAGESEDPSEPPEDTNTYICMDMLITTLGGSTDPVNIRLYNYNYEGSVADSYTDLIAVNAGTTTKIKVKVDNYLVDGQLPGFGFAVFGGPEWNTQLEDGTPDRHFIEISNVRLEGVKEQSFDLNNATVAKGTDGTGFTWANSGGAASIVDGKLVVTGGYCYDAYEFTF